MKRILALCVIRLKEMEHSRRACGAIARDRQAPTVGAMSGGWSWPSQSSDRVAAREDCPLQSRPAGARHEAAASDPRTVAPPSFQTAQAIAFDKAICRFRDIQDCHVG
jgi:hypothetical protein